MAATLDLVNRDPQNLNNYIQVEFDDSFGEPAGTHSADCVWRNSFKCFTCGKNLCYKILTYLCGICIALYWGCLFAEISFYVIWCFAPSLRAIQVLLNPFKKIWAILLGTIFAPITEVIGLVFSRIHVTQSQGQPPKPYGELDLGNESGKVKNFK